MEKHNDEIHVSEVEASGGSKEGVGRWVLLIGTLLAILLLSVVWIVPALTRSDMEQEATVSGEIRAREDSEANGSSTDSIVGAAEPTETKQKSGQTRSSNKTASAPSRTDYDQECNMSNANSFQTDQYVEWNWGNGKGKGQIKERFEREVTRTLKGSEITKDGTEDNPAYLIEQEDGDEVLKRGSELSAQD